MKKTLLAVLALSGIVLGSAVMARADIVPDTYGGPAVVEPSTNSELKPSGWDSFDQSSTGATNGSKNEFDLYGYTFTVNSQTKRAEVVIYSEQGSYFDKGIQEWGLGDLFLSTTGVGAWNYVLDLGYLYKYNDADYNDVPDYPVATTGAGLLYTVIVDDVVTVDINEGHNEKGYYRENFVLYNPNSESSIGTGTWEIVGANNVSSDQYDTLTISFNLPSDWNGTSPLYAQFAAACGNDILQMKSTPVPEPTTLLLFGAGLASLAMVGRRRFQA